MPDFHSPEDEATLYVLGELTAAKRQEFEARMAKSAELRQMVRELEEGAVVLSTGLPRRRPPSEIWSGIEKAMGRQRQPGAVAWWGIFWRNGWAAAVLCLVGWLLYAILLNHHNRIVASQPASPHETAVANTSPAAEHAVSLPPAPTNAERQLVQVRADEINDLRFRIAAMAQQSNELSQLLAQERARLGETNRIKFYHLAPASAAGGDAPAPQFSPALQQALLISIGRELGWFPVESKPRTGSGRAANTIDGIDFVDLRFPNNGGGNQPVAQPKTESQTADVTGPSMPAFVSGDKLIVGLDSSVVPPNSSVTFTVTTANGSVTGGNFVTSDNPTVVTVPLFAGAVPLDGGLAVTVNSVTSSGVSNSAQFFSTTSP